MLEDFERTKICDVVKLGCGREAAAKYVGLTLEQLQAELVRDEELAKDLLRAEGAAVLSYMGQVRKAASEEKNWRSSVWWLEQQARIDKLSGPDRVKFTEAVLETLERFAEMIVAEVTDLQRRSALLTHLMNIAAEGVGKVDESKVIDVEPAMLTSSSATEIEAPASENDGNGGGP
ncbi:hypothetical protein [Lacipirellula limnantheis]|uniref:Uncharacterized protein n=1 Tax=Lacipirellula limnantheis TaxID=2528024 RepID=A0A517U5W9_9BACT|nr:hypothetical protein [Lacipirellula limnantheis]QDT76031.1 hypothetical protein I41_52760 [Lacipirellula limnantheis]